MKSNRSHRLFDDLLTEYGTTGVVLMLRDAAIRRLNSAPGYDKAFWLAMAKVYDRAADATSEVADYTDAIEATCLVFEEDIQQCAVASANKLRFSSLAAC